MTECTCNGCKRREALCRAMKNAHANWAGIDPLASLREQAWGTQCATPTDPKKVGG